MAGVTLKAIKVSKDFLDPRKLDRAINNALDGGSLAVKVDFDVFQQTWKHKADFVIEKGQGYREVYTLNKIFAIVARGARPHIITPKRARMLVFRSKFRPKTVPGAIRSNKGFVGGKVIFAKRVRHPGHKPRDPDIAIAKKWNNLFPKTMQRAIDAET